MYKVIVLEDERRIRSYLSSFINDCIDGFYVEECFADGKDALKYLASNEVDLIITDIRMIDVSGIDVAKYVYEHGLHIKVIIISGYRSFDYAQEAIDYNVFSYLTKPIDHFELKKTLERAKALLDKETEEKTNRLAAVKGDKSDKSIDSGNMMQKALLYINQNYDKDLLLKNVADHVFFSEDYFGKLFKKYTGSNFSDYLLSVRMEKAVELLKTQRYSVAQIGQMSGYKNTNYFIKVFKDYTGHTPKKYLRYLE